MPPTTDPTVPAPTTESPPSISLRFKFIVALSSLSLLPFFFISLHLISAYSGLVNDVAGQIGTLAQQTAFVARAAGIKSSAELLVAVFLFLIVAGTYFAEKLFTGEIRTLLSWLKDARSKNFTQLSAPPLLSGDEVGELGKEMQASIVYFQTIEAREKQVLQQKSDFISVTAHQMRTPLTGLRWGIETLLSERTAEEQRKKVGIGVEATVERMIHLVDDLLDVAKMEEGKFGYRFRKEDIIPFIRKLFMHYDLLAQSKHINLTLEAPEMQEVYTDPDRLETALSNLISNAIDYTPEGGTVTVSLTDSGTRIRIAVRRYRYRYSAGIRSPIIPQILPRRKCHSYAPRWLRFGIVHRA